jgi:hypothetical protein
MLLIVRIIATGILLVTVLTGCFAIPATEDRFSLIYGPYMYHFSPKPEHNDYPDFIGIERESPHQWDLGAAYFRNSYDQPSAYLYGGKRWSFGSTDHQFYGKLTAGALLGYVGKYERSIPINWNGIGLGIIPTTGYRYRRFATQVAVLGISGLMLTIGYDFWP